MTATASVSLIGNISGLSTGTKTLLAGITSALANGVTQQYVLGAGANTILVPSLPATTGCLIILPNSNTSEVTLKGLDTDVGVPVGKTGFLFLSWNPLDPALSFVLDSVTGQGTKITEITFF